MQEKQNITTQDFSLHIEELITHNKIDSAIEKCQKLLKHNGNNLILVFYLAKLFQIKGDRTNSLKFAKLACGHNPKDLYFLEELGRIFTKLGCNGEAIVCFEKMLDKTEDKFTPLFNIAMTYCNENNLYKALESLQEARKYEENYLLFFNMGIVYRNLEDTKKAQSSFLKAAQLDPKRADPYFGLASIAEMEGKKNDTERYYLKGLDRAPKTCFAYYSLTLLRNFDLKKDKVIIDTMLSLAEDASIPNHEKSSLFIGLGKIYEGIGENEQAFAYYKQGKDLLKETAKYNEKYIEYIFHSYKDVFSQEKQKQFQNKNNTSEKPIFIVGMPRSGTTLVEQVLNAHSDVGSVGESQYLDMVLIEAAKLHSSPPFPASFNQFSPQQFAHIANLYTSYLEKLHPRAKRVINKTPDNFINIGSIFSLFPNATIINCKRHPLDVCLSTYFIHFQDNRLPYSYDLEALAIRYKQYEKFMQLWNLYYPEKIMDVYYEDLVLHQEKISKDLVEFCNLPWQTSCLEFSRNKSVVSTASKWQIRGGIYNSSVHRWKKFDAHIGILKELLQDEVQQYESKLQKRTGACQ